MLAHDGKVERAYGISTVAGACKRIRILKFSPGPGAPTDNVTTKLSVLL